jgi:RNA polymerase sigma-70 factor (ECF subfamily)
MLRPVACFARLMKVCLRRGRSQEDAEDLIQEALLRLEEYCRSAVVRNREEFLARTVANLAIDQQRRARTVAYASEPVEELARILPIIDPNPDPERVLAAEQRLLVVQCRLDAASVRTREIYFAHRSGYRYDEIAAAFDITEKTVEKHIARAVLILMSAREPL